MQNDNQMKWEELYDRALKITIQAHRGQKDKSGREYVMHPIRVAERCKAPRAKIVSLLHDTLEDTDVTVEYLRSKGFPEEIVIGVLSVTKQEGETYDDFVKRASADVIGREVKIADLEDNMDIRRLKVIKDDDVVRLRKYIHAWQYLIQLEQ